MKTLFPLLKLLRMLPEEMREEVLARVEDQDTPQLQRKSRAARLEIEEGERAAIQVISTRDIDRDEDIMDPRGVVLDDYRKNPVVMWNHDYSEPPIAKCVDISVTDEAITAKSVYSETPRAEEIYQLKREGILQAASVGFVALDWVYNGGAGWAEVVGKLKERWKMSARAFDKARRIVTKWTLLEYSDVPIPANQNALMLAIGKGLDPAVERLLKANVPEDETPPDTEVSEPAGPADSPPEDRLARIKTRPARITRVGRIAAVTPVPIETVVAEAILRRQGKL